MNEWNKWYQFKDAPQHVTEARFRRSGADVEVVITQNAESPVDLHALLSKEGLLIDNTELVRNSKNYIESAFWESNDVEPAYEPAYKRALRALGFSIPFPDPLYERIVESFPKNVKPSTRRNPKFISKNIQVRLPVNRET